MEKKSSKIFLYLLGAGASYNALPLSSNFAIKLLEFIEYTDNNPSLSKRFIFDNEFIDFMNSIRWLAQEASHHASIDTFAKKLYFKNDMEKLKELKVTLSAYLIAEQQQKHVDLRYDSFFASICGFDNNHSVCLPPNLRVLTWNYDAQLEKAFYGFCESDELVLENITRNHNQIRRINGCCGHEHPNQIDDFFTAIWDTSPDSGIESAVGLYKKYMDKDCQSTPDICFAWEETQLMSSSLLENLDEVSILVVIGYSFPYFNREMDELIFKKFGINLDKVYLQCPEDTYNSVEKRLQRLLPPDFSDESKDTLGQKDIIRINSTDLFYIPDEF